jgi:TRAP-type C4-dicarboxylate transport system permease small subunit
MARISYQRLRRIVAVVEDAILAILLAAMVLLAAAQIALRNVASTGLTWSDPALRLAVLWAALLGGMAATREQKHIRVDLLPRFLPERYRAPLQRFTDLFSAAICGVLTWHAARFVRQEMEAGSQIFAQIPAWIGQAILPIGFGVIALRFLLNAIVPQPREKPF